MDFKDLAIRAAKKAGSLMQSYQKKTIPGVKNKEGKSLVTAVDLKCEDLIVAEIRSYYQDHNILAEENKYPKTSSEYTWIIDPIDGTHNYIRKIPCYGVSIALAKGDQVVVGVLYFPSQKKLYVAERKKGATCNGKKIKVSSHPSLAFSYLLFDSSLKGRSRRSRLIQRSDNIKFSERTFGCATYECALVAEGKADGFLILETHPWDIAAGFLIIEEAGGRIFEKGKRKWTPFAKEYVSSNSKIHSKLKKLLF